MEEWKTIEEYPNYAVSNLGNVKSLRKNSILKPCLDTTGRPAVNIYNKQGRKHFPVSRLVGLIFIPNIFNLPILDHINRNVLDNRVENLRWVTHSQNQFNRIKKEGATSQFKGVSFRDKEKVWISACCIDKKTIHIGRFKTELEAAKSYNEFIVSHNLGEFAILNSLEYSSPVFLSPDNI